MATTIDFVVKRGLESALPTTKIDGTAYFCMDTGNLFFDHPSPTNSNTIVRTQISGLYAKDLVDSSGNTISIDTSLLESWLNTLEQLSNSGGTVVTSQNIDAYAVTSVPNASTSQKGIVQLSSSTSSTSTTLAATASAVKSAYDKANTASTTATSAQTTANAAMPKSGGTFTGIVYGQVNTSYGTSQLRNIKFVTAQPNSLSNGEIALVYTP